jgi:ribosomal protein S18 acetylase RimI-like enzyme
VTRIDRAREGHARRARAWHHARQIAVCDLVEPWAHGAVVRATAFPDWFSFNLLRVEDDPAMTVDALIACADVALEGLPHRRIDFDSADVAEPLRPGFHARGWSSMRLLWMRHEEEAPPGPEIPVEAVPYDAVGGLREAWDAEDSPAPGTAAHRAQARTLALRRQVRVLAATEAGVPIGFAELDRAGAVAEITEVFVHPQHRGRGCGAALLRQATAAASDARDLWICADDEDRPKALYRRLGFRPVWSSMEFLRLPGGAERGGAP